jgi:hypothetical protein
MQKTLKSYLKRLTNLTGNNRSLLLLRLLSGQFVDLHDFNHLSGNTSFSLVEALIGNKSKIKLCDEVDSRDEDVNIISKQLKRLRRIEKLIYEERGAKDLYVGWPFVSGKFNDDTLVRCPLLFFPVELSLETGEWLLKTRKDVNITFNKTFLLAYGHFNNVSISDDLLEKVIEEFDTDSTVFRTSLYQELKESNIEINFNQENFGDQLHSFDSYKKKDFEDEQRTGELKLFPEAVLGIFPQSGSHLVPDYNQLIEENSFESMEEFFEQKVTGNTPELSGINHYAFLNQVKEERIFTPFKMDAYQENALKAVKLGNSIVIQGPPGTGKSQLISNIISDGIATGKKILMVCQKKAALDVVHNRLKDKGLGNFLGLVHDFKNDRKEVYEKIAGQIEKLPDYKQKNSTLDAIQIERSFLQNSRKIDQMTEELEEFKEALYDQKECGLSVKELYLTCNLDEPNISLVQEYRPFKLDQLNEFIQKLKYYIGYAQKFNQYDHPFYNRNSFRDFSLSDLKCMQDLLDEIPQFQQTLEDRVEEITNAKLKLDDLESILNKSDQIKEMLGILKNPAIYSYFQHIVKYKDSETDMLWLSNTERVLMECYKGIGPELSLKIDELGKFQEVLQKSIQSRKGLIKLIKWELFSKDKYLIKRVLVANNLKSNKEGFETMVAMIDNRLNLVHNLTKLKQQGWLGELPDTLEKGQIQNWFHGQRLALKAKLIYKSLRGIHEHFNIQALTYEVIEDSFDKIYKEIKSIPDMKFQWMKYYTENQIKHILQNPDYLKKVKRSLQKDFDALCEFDKLLFTFSSTETAVVEKLIDFEVNNSEHDVISLFQNSIRLAWIEHIEKKYPVLRTVSSQKIHQVEQELQEAVSEKMNASNDILLQKARERTYEHVEYNRLNNLVTYRDLAHQVNKKRRIWPIRKLVANYSDELFQLIPCWMASPESVSTIFPMKEMFDLVIFDEASQCFTEKGLPAMCRGKQVVITGDSKQLRPNDLYRPRYEEDADEGIDLEVESLLELAENYLMQVKLLGHYRSDALELIDFSNQHFYNHQLKLLPDRDDINKHVPAITYIKVEGFWEKNANLIEAQKVSRLMLDQLRDHPEKEIGVVTFNSRQQELISDVFEQALIDQKLAVPKNIFIKNIENVQGDEKDIIIFSTAYAPDVNGKLNMQFGSLNMANGENRLNVAITRARQKVIIVSSIDPQQLKVDQTKNLGPKLLKEYLNYALDVSEGRYKPSITPEVSSSKNWYLKKKILENSSFEGVDFSTELPFGDITLKEGNDFLGVILTDDDLYYQNPSMKDAHAYSRFSLSNKNWKFKGIFSREYWSNKSDVEESINRFIMHHKKGN